LIWPPRRATRMQAPRIFSCFEQSELTRCINSYGCTLGTVDRIASHHDCHAASGYHFRRTLGSVIPGLTRNLGFLSGFPLSRE
jgi:hypothetical protein